MNTSGFFYMLCFCKCWRWWLFPCWSVWCQPEYSWVSFPHPPRALWAISLGPVIWKVRSLVLMRAQFIILWQPLCLEQSGNFETASKCSDQFSQKLEGPSDYTPVKSWVVQVRKKIVYTRKRKESAVLIPLGLLLLQFTILLKCRISRGLLPLSTEHFSELVLCFQHFVF